MGFDNQTMSEKLDAFGKMISYWVTRGLMETGEANVISAANIPFFPVAFHEGVNSFGIGLESARVLTQVLMESNWQTAKTNLKEHLETALNPIEAIAKEISTTTDWQYDGIDTSPANDKQNYLKISVPNLSNNETISPQN